jgi:hypothetical protein
LQCHHRGWLPSQAKLLLEVEVRRDAHVVALQAKLLCFLEPMRLLTAVLTWWPMWVPGTGRFARTLLVFHTSAAARHGPVSTPSVEHLIGLLLVGRYRERVSKVPALEGWGEELVRHRHRGLAADDRHATLLGGRVSRWGGSRGRRRLDTHLRP